MRSIHVTLALALSLALLAAAGGGETFEFQDDFQGHKPGSDGSPVWDLKGFDWAVEKGRYHARSYARDFAFPAKAPHGRQVTAEATLILDTPVSQEWKIAGLAVVRDDGNFWHLALVEGPEDEGHRHFLELSEMLDGTWLAQNSPATRLTETERKNSDVDWQYDTPYRLKLTLGNKRIRGSLADAEGNELAAIAFKLDNRAVAAGRPALTCNGFQAAFDDVAMTCSQTVPAPEKERWMPPPYTQAGRVPLPEEPKGRATGFFHVEQHDGRWWCIDPKGRPFFILGTDHARYSGHWCETLGYAPYHRNMQEAFDNEEAWAKSTAERLRAWGFNTVAAGHSESLRNRGLAWTGFIGFGSRFSSISDLCPKVHWTGFPNVFHPRFPAWCDRLAEEHCARYKDDPWLLGYFLDNELEWYGKEHREWSLVDEVFKKPADHSGKQALLAFLKERYPKIDQLNAAWGTEVASYDALAAAAEPLRHHTERGLRDKLDFLAVIAEKYFSITTAALRKHDPNHMVLGCRFAGRIPPIGDIAGKYCDIFSINCYRWVDLETGEIRGFETDLAEWYSAVQRPFMITEWSFPALDSGLPCQHGAGMRVDTQGQRARCFTIFQRFLFARPFLVGSNFFMWVDEPAQGISSTFPEDSNYGLVDVHNEPYEPLVKAASTLQPKVYDIHAGHVPELSVKLERAEPKEEDAPRPLLAVVTNTGKADAKTEMEITVNGKGRRQPIEVPAGATQRVPVDRVAGEITVSTTEGPHKAVPVFEIASQPAALVRVTVDPEGALGEVERENNVASATHVDWEQVRAPLEAMRGDRPRWAVPLAIVNRSGDAVANSGVALPLGDLPRGAAIERGARRAFQLSGDAKGAALQLDRLPFGGEVAIAVRRAEALSASAMGLGFAEDQDAGGATGDPPVRFERGEGTWRASNGVLQLIKEKPGGNAFDRVLLLSGQREGGKGSFGYAHNRIENPRELGRFVPVIWQNLGQDLWPRPDSARIAGVSNGPVRLVLDIEFELTPESPQKVLTAVDDQGDHAAAARRPGAFKAAYRFSVYPGKPWVGVRFLWIENTDARPWDFQAYFHYALSRLGGDASDDEVGGPKVPNYYARDRAVTWFDPRAKLHYGIAQGRDTDFQMHFWTDPGGGQHADVRREIKVTLQPGQRWPAAQPGAAVPHGAAGSEQATGKTASVPQPTAYLFGAAGGPGQNAWMPIAEAVRRREALQVRVPAVNQR